MLPWLLPRLGQVLRAVLRGNPLILVGQLCVFNVNSLQVVPYFATAWSVLPTVNLSLAACLLKEKLLILTSRWVSGGCQSFALATSFRTGERDQFVNGGMFQKPKLQRNMVSMYIVYLLHMNSFFDTFKSGVVAYVDFLRVLSFAGMVYTQESVVYSHTEYSHVTIHNCSLSIGNSPRGE